MEPTDEGRPPLIGMALYADVTYDSRVRREAGALAAAGYRVRIYCLAGEESAAGLAPGVTLVTHQPTTSGVLPRSANPYRGSPSRLAATRARIAWLSGYVRNLRSWGRWVLAQAGDVDAWLAHDLTGLVAIAPAIGTGVPVVYDAHEIYLEAGTARLLPRPVRAALRRYEGRLVARVSALVTVNASLEEVFRSWYRPRRVVVLHNCPDRWQRPPDLPDKLRAAAGIPGDAPVILHHGSLGPSRGIEQLMDAILEAGLERSHLVLLGFGESRERFRAMAEEGDRRGRVHVLDAVPPSELLPWVASADVGALPIQASTLNHRLATPNKLFECLAAGVPVLVSDFPPMRAIVLDDPRGPLGAVCDPSDVGSVAAGLRSLLQMDAEDTATMRANCSAAASDRWNWQSESARLITLYDDLLGTMRDKNLLPAPTA